MKFLIIVFVGVMLVAFQNCSGADMQFADKGGAIGEKLEGGDEIPEESLNEAGDPPPANPDTAQVECTKLYARIQQLKPFPSGGSLSQLRGNHAYKADRIEAIESTQGSIQVVGLGDLASVGSVSGAIGNLLFCNIDVDRIHNTSQGNIIVVGGNVIDVDSFKGNITVIGGQILGQVTNSQGNIDVR